MIAGTPIEKIFTTGELPPEFLPVTAEDQAAVQFLQATIWPITNEMVLSNADRLRQLLPVEKLCLILARLALPVLHRVGGSARNSIDVANELRKLASYIHFWLKAEPHKGSHPFTEENIYQSISKRQLWLIHLWPPVKSPTVATIGNVFRWLDGTFLLLPLKLHAHYFLGALSPSEMPQKAVDWLLGYESSPDWFLAERCGGPRTVATKT